MRPFFPESFWVTSFLIRTSDVADGPAESLGEEVCSTGPSNRYSIPCCFLSCSKFSFLASRSSFDLSIFSGWWYRTVPMLVNIRLLPRMWDTDQQGNDFGSWSRSTYRRLVWHPWHPRRQRMLFLLCCWQYLGEFGYVHCQSSVLSTRLLYIVPNRTKLSK
jgi:hypothetical protein